MQMSKNLNNDVSMNPPLSYIRSYSQSEYRKAVAYSMILHSAFPWCAALIVGHCIFYRMVYRRVYTKKLQETNEIFHGISRESLIINY